MPQLIEVIVSPTGETKIETKGFQGGSCQDASKFLEQALGLITAEQRTSDYYVQTPTEQEVHE